jgi:Family of unknown function (DUF5344)
MSEEVKINYTPIEKALVNLKTSAQAMDYDIVDDFQGDNMLDMITKINEINHLLEEVLSTYQSLLLEHGQSTVEAINQFVESEQAIASSIQFLEK